MAADLPTSRMPALRPTLMVALGVAVVAIAAGVLLYQRTAPMAPPAPGITVSPRQITAQPEPPRPPTVVKPSFDVVRITPQGEAVMAGRAAPSSKVTILDAGKPIGEVQADHNGDWVFTPTAPLPAGPRELTLAEQAANGTQTRSERSVVLVVPPAAPPQAVAANSAPALAVLTGPDTTPRVLTGPAPEPGAAASPLALGAMEYDEHGEVRFSGTAPPGAAVRVYIDNQPIGGTVADPQGHWSVAARNALAAGGHNVRLDQIGLDGRVTARLERPFAREEMAAVQLPTGQIEIAHGQNLWTIARHAYGHGIRYLVIFQANRKQIRDPNLIYPGQIFTLPTDSPPAMPASSSTSR